MTPILLIGLCASLFMFGVIVGLFLSATLRNEGGKS